MLLNCGVGEDLRIPWTARRSNQSILKEISPEYSLEGLMLKRQYFGHLMWRTDSLEKTWCWERLRAGGGNDRGWDGWQHHWLNGREFEQVSGVGEGQGSLACCSPWGHKKLDATEQLNWTESKCPTGDCINKSHVCVLSHLVMSDSLWPYGL